MKNALRILFGVWGMMLPLMAGDPIVVKGSDTLGAKLVPQWKDAFVAEGHEVEFEIAAEGSSAGFTNLLAGTADVGMSSRDVKGEERNSFVAQGLELHEITVAWDMIVLVGNRSNRIRNLTLEQIEGIFTGDIKDWAEIGGEPGLISIYTRNTASGTYKSFQKMAMRGRDYAPSTQKMAGNEQIAEEVANNPNGIGYVGYAYAHKGGLRPIKVDGVRASPRNTEEYPLSRPLYFYVVGDSELDLRQFIDWCLTSEEAGKIAQKVGFVPVSPPPEPEPDPK